MKFSLALIVSTLTALAVANPLPEVSETSEASEYQTTVLKAHNDIRARHGTPALKWNTNASSLATTWAKGCQFEHGGAPNLGQNLAGNSKNDVTYMINDQWYVGEYKDYEPYFGKEPDMAGFHDFGHLTQVIWKGTTSVGCATVDCRSEMGYYFTVCNYAPQGRW